MEDYLERWELRKRIDIYGGARVERSYVALLERHLAQQFSIPTGHCHKTCGGALKALWNRLRHIYIAQCETAAQPALEFRQSDKLFSRLWSNELAQLGIKISLVT